jgi:hypothetical protein
MARVGKSVRLSGALALGLGALLGGEAQADHSPAIGGTLSTSSNVVLRADGDTIYISERGGAFRELTLGHTAEAAELRRLLKQAGAESLTVPVGSFVVANGGGNASGVKPKDDASAPAKKGKSKRKRPTHAHG